MSALPIPNFQSVTEVATHQGRIRMICPDLAAGSSKRFSVIEINPETGKTRCIGRELPLGQSQDVAYGKHGGRPTPP